MVRCNGTFREDEEPESTPAHMFSSFRPEVGQGFGEVRFVCRPGTAHEDELIELPVKVGS